MTSQTDPIIYKILAASEWQAAVTAGSYAGSPDDTRDGFIHFSTAAQLAGTAAKYFKDKPDLVLVAVATDLLGGRLRWEPSRGGQLFPHLYSPLETNAATAVLPLPLGADGVPLIPREIAP